MATYVKFQPFIEAVNEKKHNIGADTITVFLTNAAPNASDATLSQITEISYTNCSSRVVTISASSQTGGAYSAVATDLVLTASGTVGPFRYVGLYNDTAASDELICYADYGSSITLNTGETFTIDFGATLYTMA